LGSKSRPDRAGGEFGGRGRQFDRGQQRRALELLESVPWGDLDRALQVFELCLQLLLEVTADDFRRWEDGLGERLEVEYGCGECEVPARVIADFDEWERLAYVARLLRTLAMMYGVSSDVVTRVGEQAILVGEEDAHSPAALLRGLNDITWTPLMDAGR